jgi:DNA repair exonuclease SbcCD ATPase subunit
MEKLGTSMQMVLDMIRAKGPMTDKELCAAINLPDGAVRPARLRLYRRGLVEPDGNGGWLATPPERQEDVRQAAARKPPRRRKLADISLAERVAIATVLLEDSDVNRVLTESVDQRRAWRRARARAKGIDAEHEHERRERRAEAAQAEKERSTYVDFLKTRNNLKDAVEVVLGVNRFLEDDFARYERGEATRIPPTSWPDVLRNVTELLSVVVVLHQRLHEVLGEPIETCPLCGTERRAEPDVIDAEVLSELPELAEGS